MCNRNRREKDCGFAKGAETILGGYGSKRSYGNVSEPGVGKERSNEDGGKGQGGWKKGDLSRIDEKRVRRKENRYVKNTGE